MKKSGIIYLNQMAGPLFRELAEDLAKKWAPSLLFTGNTDTLAQEPVNNLRIIPAPVYDRSSIITRLVSWVKYFISSIILLGRCNNYKFCLIVSNPPFQGLVGLLFKMLRGQPYVMLVYDIYPDILVNTKRIKNGILARGWDKLNEMVYKNAANVITISQDMASRLEDKLNNSAAHAYYVPAIFPWADVSQIQPIEKEKNRFVKHHCLENKMVVLYSGNMGYTHDIESILDAAKELVNKPEIKFLFIGDGAKRNLIEETKRKNRLKNITLLPFQPESVLPYSISSGDLGIVTYQTGSEGCMLPSKACYYMAAGLVPVVISDHQTSLTKMVDDCSCGVWIKKNRDSLVKVIMDFHSNPEKLNRCKKSARKTAEKFFSRNNTVRFVEIIQESMDN